MVSIGVQFCTTCIFSFSFSSLLYQNLNPKTFDHIGKECWFGFEATISLSSIINTGYVTGLCIRHVYRYICDYYFAAIFCVADADTRPRLSERGRDAIASSTGAAMWSVRNAGSRLKSIRACDWHCKWMNGYRLLLLKWTIHQQQQSAFLYPSHWCNKWYSS